MVNSKIKWMLNRFQKLLEERASVRERLSNKSGFSMLEAVVVVGVLLALAIGGFLSYGNIAENAKYAKVNSAASEVYTAVMVSKIDGDSTTKAGDVLAQFNDSNKIIKVTMKDADSIALIPAMTPEDSVSDSETKFCVVATLIENTEIFSEKGSCDISDENESDRPSGITPPKDDYVWDNEAIMTTVWDTSIAKTCEIITLPISGTKEGITVDWNDGRGPIAFTAQSPNYGNIGEVEITVSGNFDKWGSSDSGADTKCLTQVTKWGNTATTDASWAFHQAEKLTLVKAIPQSITNLYAAFSNVKSNPDISGIRTPNVTNMAYMFNAAINFNKPMTFDTSNVNNMDNMFAQAESFDQLVQFNTKNVTNMSAMFYHAEAFNQSISHFNMSNVVYMGTMFRGAYKFDQPVVFITPKLESIRSMFYDATSFDEKVSLTTSGVTNMEYIFSGAKIFNSQVIFTDTSEVTSMNNMFSRAAKFDQPLNFNTSSVTNMGYMFDQASSFNQDLSGWTATKVTNKFRFDNLTTNWILPNSRPKWNI
jgi:type II secretory pathway pseudopilin PulG